MLGLGQPIRYNLPITIKGLENDVTINTVHSGKLSVIITYRVV